MCWSCGTRWVKSGTGKYLMVTVQLRLYCLVCGGNDWYLILNLVQFAWKDLFPSQRWKTRTWLDIQSNEQEIDCEEPSWRWEVALCQKLSWKVDNLFLQPLQLAGNSLITSFLTKSKSDILANKFLPPCNKIGMGTFLSIGFQRDQIVEKWQSHFSYSVLWSKSCRKRRTEFSSLAQSKQLSTFFCEVEFPQEWDGSHFFSYSFPAKGLLVAVDLENICSVEILRSDGPE